MTADEHFRCLTTCRVSISLCRFIFESPKVNDALLFMTILSTDLKALKRRGYNGAPSLATTLNFLSVAESLSSPDS